MGASRGEEKHPSSHQSAETRESIARRFERRPRHQFSGRRRRAPEHVRSLSIDSYLYLMENDRNNQAPPLPPGYYPSAAAEQRQAGGGKKPRRASPTASRGDKGFIQGCLAALCCCWICEMCCD